jgi:D-alanine-D-alanine ligase
VAPGRLVGSSVSTREAASLVAALGLPLFVKPACGGSSYGVTRVTRLMDLAAAVEVAAAFGPYALVEPEIRGREIDVAILERPDGVLAASPLLQVEPDPAEPFFTTAAKYASDRTRFLVPAPVEPDVAAGVAATARLAFRALGCAGLARVDTFVDEAGRVVVNELNTFPGFTEHSQVPRMWQATGLSFRDLLEMLVDTALARRAGQGPSRRPVAPVAPAPADADRRDRRLVESRA